jgi:hypothetical protein
MSALQTKGHDPLRADKASERFAIAILRGTEYVEGYAVSENDGALFVHSLSSRSWSRNHSGTGRTSAAGQPR